MLRSISTAAMMAGLALSPAACAQDVKSADKEAIEAIVKDYLLENPEIIIEALNVLDERRAAEAAEETKKALASTALYEDYSIGPDDAKITIVEFFDYRCGYCKSAANWVNSAPDKYKGKVRVVFKEMPILSPQSRNAALAALAAGKQGKYTEMHQALMKDRSEFSADDIDRVALSVGIDVVQMRKDMKSAEFSKTLEANIDLAERVIGDRPSAPTFVVEGEVVRGADIKRIEQLIKQAS